MKEVILIDGGLECELMNLGYKIDSNNTRLWTGSVLYNSPETLKQAHKNFLKNGAQVITTASYQLSIDVLKEELNCSVDEAKDMIRKSVKIAKEAVESEEQNCERKGLIAGSIGPYGASLCDLSEYSGSYAKNLTIEFLIKWHKARFECLIEEGCDLIAFETIPCIKEASALIELLSQYPKVKAWLSFSCKDNEHICNGDKFKDAYELFNNNSQLVAIGVNCTEAEFVSGLLRSVQKEDVSTPFIVYPNYKDYVWDKDKNKYVPDVDDSAWFNNGYITEWIDLGAKYIGGCCNVNSDNIGTIKSIIDKHKVE